MKNTRLLVAAVSMLAGSAAFASDTTSQDVDITVSAVNEITVGATVTLNINTATAGSNPTGTAASTWNITTNSVSSKKVTAQLSAALTTGLALSANLQAPSTGVSAGLTALTTSPSDVVTSIEAVASTGLTINYSASATVAVAPNSYSAEVTYTIVDD